MRARLGLGEGLVRKEEAFDGLSSEEDKVGLLSEDGKERDAIVIAIRAIQRRGETREDKHSSYLLLLSLQPRNLSLYPYI